MTIAVEFNGAVASIVLSGGTDYLRPGDQA